MNDRVKVVTDLSMSAIEVFGKYIRESSEALRILEERLRALEQGPARSEYLTFKDAKMEYDLSAPTLYRKIDSEQLSLYAIGGKSLLKRSEIEALIVKRPPRPPRYIPQKNKKH